jgi:hypothetical protein
MPDTKDWCADQAREWVESGLVHYTEAAKARTRGDFVAVLEHKRLASDFFEKARLIAEEIKA